MMLSPFSRFVPLILLASVLAVLPSQARPAAPSPPSLNDPGFHPIQQMYFLKKAKPDVERIGVLWKEGVGDQEEKLQTMQRAAAAIQGQLFLAYVESASDVGPQFRELTREHNIDALWIVENDGIVDAATPRQYLIANALKQGIPLVAPTEAWVSEGAPMAVRKIGNQFHIVLNERAAAATALEVPAEYESVTELVASNE
jgi:putative ABC transport system substrate-binding protein